jgi:MFS transporter, UMF1 family
MTQPTRVIPKRAVASWILYDLANTIFSMGVVSLYFSLYVRDQVGAQQADRVYGVITAVSMGIIFIVSPLLGAMTDRARRRMPFLVWSTIICCGCTALIARGPYQVSALLFVVANAAYQAGLQFYDALLPEVSTEENRGRIGGLGVGLGYLGSYIAVGIGLLLGTQDKPLLFTIIAVVFMVLAVPCFIFVKERGNPNPKPVFGLRMIQESTAQTMATLRGGKAYPGLLRFLVGRVFYTDAINTVISYMSLYTVNVAISTGLS